MKRTFSLQRHKRRRGAGGIRSISIIPGKYTLSLTGFRLPLVFFCVLGVFVVKISPQAPANPTAEQILEKYVQACGGRAAIGGLISRVSKGRRMYSNGSVEWFELYLKAPDKWLAIYKTDKSMERYGFDGSRGWFDAHWPDISKLPREVDLYTPLRLREWYPDMKFVGIARVEDRTTYVTEGSWSGRPPDRYYFDAETGLLLRQDDRARTTVSRGSDSKTQETANKPVEYYFSQYRSVKGVKLPFVVRRKDSSGVRTEIFHEIRHDVPIPDSKFWR